MLKLWLLPRVVGELFLAFGTIRPNLFAFHKNVGEVLVLSFSLFMTTLLFTNISVKADFEGAWAAYEKGKYNIAVREFLRCAERGHDKCQLYLGDIYRYGHGTVVRKDKALDWYLKSVHQKNAVAATRLYSWYLHNAVMPEDQVKAYMWFKIAKVLGQDLGRKREERLVKGMTSGQVTESQRLATEWWMTHQ